MRKAVLICMASLFVAVLFCGCAAAADTPAEDKLMADVFNAIAQKDYVTAKKLMAGVIDETDLDKALPSMSDYIMGTVVEYTKTGYSVDSYIGTDGKNTAETFTYGVKTQYGDYTVKMVLLRSDGGRKMIGYEVAKAPQSGGAILDLNDFDMIQPLMLLLSAVCLVLFIFALVKCAKAYIRLKVLWIVLIILLNAGFSVVKTASGTQTHMLLFIGISSLIKYANGDYMFSVMLPLGAILFLCLRRRLVASAAPPKEAAETDLRLSDGGAAERRAGPLEPEENNGELDNGDNGTERR